MENEGVAAYFLRAETCCNTSLHAENSRVGGDFPPQNIYNVRYFGTSVLLQIDARAHWILCFVMLQMFQLVFMIVPAWLCPGGCLMRTKELTHEKVVICYIVT